MDLLTVKEAAEESRMSVSWWRQRIHMRQIKFVRFGRRVFIPREVLEDLLRKSVVKAQNKYHGFTGIF